MPPPCALPYRLHARIARGAHRRLATFYSRSRKGRWCKGETSGHFIRVLSVHPDCDRDSLVYLSDPIGPACHTARPPRPPHHSPA